jgi:hypothetical protein
MDKNTKDLLKNAMYVLEKSIDQISDDKFTFAAFNLGMIYQALHQALVDEGEYDGCENKKDPADEQEREETIG